MGQYVSSYVLEDFAINRNLSIEHDVKEWDVHEPKNVDYYDGKRFFKVSRSCYPNYVKGYLYGYYSTDS